MSLLIRYSPDEGVLRSTGDPPNGVLSLAGGGARFVITSSWEPDRTQPGAQLVEGPPPSDAADVPVEDVVEACAGKREIASLLRMTVGALIESVKMHATMLNPDGIEAAAAHYRKVVEAAEERVQRG